MEMKTRDFAVVKSDSTVITFFISVDGDSYWEEEKNEHLKKVCPCCGVDYIREEYDICLTCGWEYDPVQNDRPDLKGGANSDSLNEHRDWYKRMYTKDKRSKWCDTWKN